MKYLKHTLQDKDMERIMGNLLRYGVILSAMVVIIGAVVYLFQHGSETTQYKQFLGEPRRLIEINEVLKHSFQGNGRSIVQLGLFVLIATPIARIIFSIVGYILEKDFLYIIITMIVLSVILYNL